MNSIRSACALVLTAAFAAAALTAQTASSATAAQPGGAASTAPTAGAAGEAPKPNPILKQQLQYFAGTWRCTGASTMGKGHATTATATLAWELNGFFLNVRYQEKKTPVNPMPLTAVEHWGYSDELKKLVAGQVDNYGGYGTQATSGWEGDTMVWTGDYHSMGTKMPSRDTFVKKSEHELTHLGEVQMNGAWTKQDEETCHQVTRK
jgi:hypothetical protein